MLTLGNMRRRLNGFTLIELLVVTAILGMVGAAIVACFAGGIRAWSAAREFDIVEREATIGWAIMEKDLRNSFQFYGIGFVGQSKEVSFPVLVSGNEGEPLDAIESDQKRIGTVAYFYDKKERVLRRKEWPFPEQEPAAGCAEPIMANLEDVNIEYRELSAEASGGGSWLGSWVDTTNAPVGVRVGLYFATGGEQVLVQRTLFLPLKSRK